jgi:hypothetical protein
MVDISRPALDAHHTNDSTGRKRYKRDDSEERRRDDFGDQYAYHDEYRKTSANMFGNSIFEVTRDIRSRLTHPTSDVRTAPPSSAQSTVASSGTPSSPRDSFSFRSSRDPESVPTTPEQHSRSYHHPLSGRHSDEGDEEESLISRTKLMRVQSATWGGEVRIRYDYRKDSSPELPPPTKMRPTRSSSPPRASGSSQSHSSGIDEDEDFRDPPPRHPLPPPYSVPVGSPNVSTRVSNWVGDVDRRTPHQTVLSPPPIVHMAAPSFEPRIPGPSYPEFRRPPYMQQSSYGSTSISTTGDEEDYPIEDETDELEESDGERSDGDPETSGRPSLKRGSSSGHGHSTTTERLSAGGAKNLKNNGIHYCPHCVASFRRNFDMNRHIASIHAERTDLTCPGCPSRSRPFSRRDALRRHLKSVINQNPTPRRRICNLTPAEASSIMERLSK